LIADGGGYVRRVNAISGVISTVAGNGNIGLTGMNGPATSASFYSPQSIAVDPSGVLYISTIYGVICRVSTAGIISIFAGSTAGGLYSGEGGPAAQATLIPGDLAADGSGNLLVSDFEGLVLRIDAASTTIHTVAGSPSVIGDNGPAASAAFRAPTSIALDSSGNLFIGDAGDRRVRKVSASTGVITTVAGDGRHASDGDGGPATRAAFSPYQALETRVAVDPREISISRTTPASCAASMLKRESLRLSRPMITPAPFMIC
jgi:hypothetical protein